MEKNNKANMPIGNLIKGKQRQLAKIDNVKYSIQVFNKK